MERRKKVVVLATGGTIAGEGRPGDATDYVPGKLTINEIAKGVRGLDEIADLEEVQIANLNSDDITSSLWIKLASTINRISKDDSVDGFVITHGTDTMEETAYFLHLVVKTNKPVVVTGAIDIMGTWIFGVPLALISSSLLHLPIHLVYLILSMEEVVRLFVGFIVFRKGKWMKSL